MINSETDSSLITVIVPVYNAQEHLSACLESIRKQTFGEWECVCVDDGSTDESVAIVGAACKEDGRFRLIRADHAGPGPARNRGLSDVCTEWFTFVDADDRIHPALLQRLLASARTHSADLVVCAIQESTNPYPESEPFRNGGDAPSACYAGSVLHLMPDWRRFRVHPTGKLYRSDVHGTMRFPALFGAEDAYAAMDVFARTRTSVFMGDPLYEYRDTPNSLTRSCARYRNYIEGDTQVVLHGCDLCLEQGIDARTERQIVKPYIMRIFHHLNLMAVDRGVTPEARREMLALAANGLRDVRERVAKRHRVIPIVHMVTYLGVCLRSVWLIGAWQTLKRRGRSRRGEA